MKRKNRLIVELPEEFIHRCQNDGVTPEIVLRGFIADLCGIINWHASPREDGYSSNGSDERRMAQDYYDRVGTLTGTSSGTGHSCTSRPGGQMRRPGQVR